MHRVRVHVRGQVQGVGFRWFAQREASALGLAGRVWNLPDGSVGVEAEGDRAALERFLDVLREGPSRATVTGVDASWSEGPARHSDFGIARPS